VKVAAMNLANMDGADMNVETKNAGISRAEVSKRGAIMNGRTKS
jgi:hypothetical protein